jgi:hypothetical protein
MVVNGSSELTAYVIDTGFAAASTASETVSEVYVPVELAAVETRC